MHVYSGTQVMLRISRKIPAREWPRAPSARSPLTEIVYRSLCSRNWHRAIHYVPVLNEPQSFGIVVPFRGKTRE